MTERPMAEGSLPLEANEPYLERIGDVAIALNSDDPRLARDEEIPTSLFRIDPGARVDMRLRAEWGTAPLPAGARLVFDSEGVWRLLSDGATYVFEFSSPSTGKTPYKRAICDRRLRYGTILVHPDCGLGRSRIDPLEFPLDELLVIHHLADRRGIEVHACGVCDDRGTGYLFCGTSGAGKTTMARLWHGRPGIVVLSDDRIILRLHGDGVWIYGTPWHGAGSFASPRPARLGHLCFLEHGARCELRPLSLQLAIAQMLARAFAVFHQTVTLASALEVCEQICRRVPAWEFAFTPDAEAPSFVERMLG